MVVYALVRPYVTSDAAALAIGGIIPVARTLVVIIVLRRLDWIGGLSILGFAVAWAASAIFNGSEILLKVHGSLLTGTLGVVLLVSVLIGKPLLLPVLQAIGRQNPDVSGAAERESASPGGRKKISLATVVIGLALFTDGVVHVVLALSLPTNTFLAVARVVNWAILGGGVAILYWLRRG
jgi:hypothetical protein